MRSNAGEGDACNYEISLNLGAYTVRYLFVICGFSTDEPKNLGTQFLLDRLPSRSFSEGWSP